jgi:uncharacterized protein (UPF0264 family)
MEEILKNIATQGPTVAVMAVMIYYFIKQQDKKETQNQTNLERFVDLQKESNLIHSRTGELLNTMLTKLNDMHTDVRNAKCKKSAE